MIRATPALTATRVIPAVRAPSSHTGIMLPATGIHVWGPCLDANVSFPMPRGLPGADEWMP